MLIDPVNKVLIYITKEIILNLLENAKKINKQLLSPTRFSKVWRYASLLMRTDSGENKVVIACLVQSTLLKRVPPFDRIRHNPSQPVLLADPFHLPVVFVP